MCKYLLRKNMKTKKENRKVEELISEHKNISVNGYSWNEKSSKCNWDGTGGDSIIVENEQWRSD